MQLSPFHFWTVPCFALLLTLSSARAESPSAEDEQTLLSAGLSSDGRALLAFFHARARTEIDRDRLRELLRQFADGSDQERDRATTELLGLGPLALPLLRQTANDLDHPDTAARASRCLPWLEGPSSSRLLVAAAHTLAQRKPEGAAGALLAYLPFAVDADVIAAVNAALLAVAVADGKPDTALLRGLEDPSAVRRAAAGVALCCSRGADATPLAVRKLLKDPAVKVRLRAALALAEAHDAEAIPVLIDLLAELDAEQRASVENFLMELAGEWAPRVQFQSDDEISRRIRRDAWASWWRHTDGATLLGAVAKHTLTADKRQKVRQWIVQLGDDEFASREKASKALFALGRLALPQLREALQDRDAEVSQRAKLLTARIEREPSHHLPIAALRLLALRKPAGAVEALLAYVPYAEDEARSEEVRRSLTVLALRDGKADPALVRTLSDNSLSLRVAAIQALAKGGGADGRSAVRELLADDAPLVRFHAALALALAQERDSIPVLIDLLAVLPSEQAGRVEETLYQLAGDSAPKTSVGTEAAEREKCRDAWAAWWKVNALRVDLARLIDRPLLGYTVVCDVGQNRVYELDRHGKVRWAINNLQCPTHARVLPGNRVLIAEHNSQTISERDFKGKVLWSKEKLPSKPMSVQRLGNGNTFIATETQVLEVDRAGKEVYTIDVPGGVWEAYRSRSGVIFCLTAKTNQGIVLDATGKQLRTFDSNHGGQSGSLDLLSNGHILVTQPHRNKVVEFDQAGKTIREVEALGVTAAVGLPEGHILASSQNAPRVFELDRAGKVVWEHKSTSNVFRARRR
ncbi:MAG TPA: HEAT repeat domain-containing protein [Gemmataceae bacterium]|jgi:HEAT repeat protein